jgi:hypothetical protein
MPCSLGLNYALCLASFLPLVLMCIPLWKFEFKVESWRMGFKRHVQTKQYYSFCSKVLGKTWGHFFGGFIIQQPELRM